MSIFVSTWPTVTIKRHRFSYWGFFIDDLVQVALIKIFSVTGICCLDCRWINLYHQQTECDLFWDPKTRSLKQCCCSEDLCCFFVRCDCIVPFRRNCLLVWAHVKKYLYFWKQTFSSIFNYGFSVLLSIF